MRRSSDICFKECDYVEEYKVFESSSHSVIFWCQ